MRPLLYRRTYWTHIQSAFLCVCAYIYIHTCTHIYTYTSACMRPGGAGPGAGSERSPPIAPLSSLYRCGGGIPIFSNFPNLQMYPSDISHLLTFTYFYQLMDLYFYAFFSAHFLLIISPIISIHNLVPKNLERSAIQTRLCSR